MKRLNQKVRGCIRLCIQGGYSGRAPPDYRPALKCVEMAVIQNMVNPMKAPCTPVGCAGKQRAEDGVKSKGRSVMERIALQDLGHSERKLTYAHGLNLR